MPCLPHPLRRPHPLLIAAALLTSGALVRSAVAQSGPPASTLPQPGTAPYGTPLIGGGLMLQGDGLKLSVMGSLDTVIRVDDSLHGQVRVRYAGPPACLATQGGRQAEIRLGECDEEDEDGHHPPALRLEVPAHFAASISVTGSGDIDAGALGPVEISVEGSGDFHAGSTGPLSVTVAGSGDTSVGQVDGPVAARVRGSGDISIGTAGGPVAVDRAGSGDVTIGGTAWRQ